MPSRARARFRSGWAVALLALAAAAPAAPSADEEPAPSARAVLERRVSLSLVEASAAAAFRPFEAILGLERVEVREVTGRVTIHLDDVSARTVLNALCESLGCRWTLRADRGLLEVQAIGRAAPEAAPELEQPVDLRLEEADAFEVLIGFGKLLRSGVELELDTEAKTVTLVLENRPLREALDEVCRQLDCRWSYGASGERSLLEFSGPGGDRRRVRRGAG